MKLQESPDWHAAASDLVVSFTSLESRDDRIRLMDKLCDKLDNGLYPAFLQILYCVEQYGDDDAKQLVANTFSYALSTGRLPAGKVLAWGSSNFHEGTGFGQTRNLGPLEFICAWYAQPCGLPPLTQAAFSSVATSLLRLFSLDTEAHQLYRNKLLADSEDPLIGSLSGQTRAGLAEMAQSWSADSSPNDLINTFIGALNRSSPINQINTNPFA